MTLDTAYTLSAIQLVCHLIIFQISGIDAAVIQPPPQYQSQDPMNGYVAYPDIGFGYKVYNRSVSWIDAKNLCIEDGAQLALIDSVKKLEYVASQRKSPGSAHVGILRMYDDTMWIGISTGLPVSSLPWAPYEPWGDQDCVLMSGDGSGLVNHSCDLKSNYVCEIPYSEGNEIEIF